MARAWLLGLAWLALAAGAAAEDAAAEKPLPRELAGPLEQARAAYDRQQWEEAARILSSYTGPDHPVRHLLLGHSEAQRGRWREATAAYRKALALDERYRAAGIALAQACLHLADLPETLRVAGCFIDPAQDKADEVVFYAQAAYLARDLRLAARVTRRALERFPNDDRVRRLDLALLCEERDWPEAARAALTLLRRTPADAALWEQYARAGQGGGDQAEATAALEAAWLCNPDDPDALRRFLSAQLSAGHVQEVLQHGDRLLPVASGPTTAKVDAQLATLLVRAADAAGDDARLRRWLAAVPERERGRDLLLCSARSALRRGDNGGARAALQSLIAHGQADAAVYVWAGRLAEEAGDSAEAEAQYRQALTVPDADDRPAALCLAALCHSQGRDRDARELLESYLNRNPADAAARAMLAVFAQTAKTDKN